MQVERESSLVRVPYSAPQQEATTIEGELTAKSPVTRKKISSPSARASRIVSLVILTLIGLWLFAGIGGHRDVVKSATARTFTSASKPIGSQAGGVVARTEPSFCLPTDTTCLLNSVAQWVASGILGIFQPLIDAIDRNSLNFISQTPICVSACPTNDSPYQENATVATFVNWSVGVADLAVTVFVAIGGYNIMIARQIGANYSEVAEFIPRIALAVLAANLCLYFLQFFIDLENAVCLEVIHLFNLTILTDTIVGIFHSSLLQEGLLVWSLALLLGIMNLLLAWQMLVRLALLFLLIVLAPWWLLCFGLPQTQEYGRLGASTFASTLFVQFFQIVVLSLGGMLITFVQTANILHLDAAVLSLFVSAAVMSLVLRIPSMLRTWALRPVADAGPAGARAFGSAVEFAAGTAVRAVQVFL